MPVMFKNLQERHQKRLEDTKKFFKLDTLKNLKIAYIPYNELFKEGVIAGVGWAVGVTIGFVLISSVLVLVLRQLGGLPLIGEWIASILEETQSQLLKRTPIIPQ